MPIKLDQPVDSSQLTDTVNASPKYFCSQLTGYRTKNGLIANRGVLAEGANPSAVKAGVRKLVYDEIDLYARHFRNAQTEVNLIPISPEYSRMWKCVDEVKLPNFDDALFIAENKSGDKVYLTLDIHSIVLERRKIDNITQSITRSVWKVALWIESAYAKRMNKRDVAQNTYPGGLFFDRSYLSYHMLHGAHKTDDHLVHIEFQSDITGVLDTIIDTCVTQGWKIDATAVRDAYKNVCTLDKVVDVAVMWQTTLPEKVIEIINYLAPEIKNNDITACHSLMHTMNCLEGYPVKLQFYKPIYDELKAQLRPEMLDRVVKSNLNLLLNDTMEQLANTKHLLERVPNHPTAKADSFFSKNQAQAIESHEPLILVQSGAGTGKSSTIRGRIKFMEESGINPHDITVLSFTNAAADHISEICPGVNSMTIASMVHTIYSENFPTHELSGLKTLINTIRIEFGVESSATANVARQFISVLSNVGNNETDSFTTLNNFIEKNYDAVVEILNACQQTTLEIEIIMCYQHIGDYAEPDCISSRHLIVDEVQDNSIFEFIYILKYINKHQESLYIVGDCSQTLFEFRASNPRALNIMEASGVFATYKLQTNYRSNQDILDFANVTLACIEANRYANIRLRANDLTPPTEASFTEHVKLETVGVSKVTEFHKNAFAFARDHLTAYIDECLARNEHVCVLAHSHAHLNAFKSALELLYPDKTLVNIASRQAADVTVLSEFIRQESSTLAQMDRHNIVNQIIFYIGNNIGYYTHSKASYMQDAGREFVAAWAAENRAIIDAWNASVDAGQMTELEFFNKLRSNLLRFEIKTNAIKKNVMSQKNRQVKENLDLSKVDIVFSTIHSAKGLEFDNVIVLFHDSKVMGEADKRMYYVAFTRAMRSELILAWSVHTDRLIEAQYNAVLDEIRADEKRRALDAAAQVSDTSIDPDAQNNASVEVNG